VQLIGGPEGGISITEPSLLFMPRANAHTLIADDRDGADVVCAAIQFGAGGANPITDSLPGIVLVPLSELPGAQPLLELLYEEAFSQHAGRQAALDRMCEILLIRLLRCCIDRGLVQGGALSGLADPRLAKALTALHADPAREWELTDMADLAGMSRARFAVHFRDVTGETPANYLASWRINLAQSLLKAGRPLKHVSMEVGYGSPSALTRAFVRKLGVSPMHWLKGIESAAAVP
jgi:AraC-like DNA-binding protein